MKIVNLSISAGGKSKKFSKGWRCSLFSDVYYLREKSRVDVTINQGGGENKASSAFCLAF